MRRLATLLCATLFVGCGTSRPPRAALVFASASLGDAFEELAAEFARAHPGERVEVHAAGTPQLVLQLREGARADLFASADEASMERVVALGRAAEAPRAFATNRLALLVAAGNPEHVRGLSDLARADLRVLLCGPEVPAGRYARAALARADVVARSASDEPSVRAVVSKVALGEADVGVAYVTDARPELGLVELGAAENVVARYTLAVLDGGDAPATAADFRDFVVSERGREVLARHRFGGAP